MHTYPKTTGVLVAGYHFVYEVDGAVAVEGDCDRTENLPFVVRSQSKVFSCSLFFL